MNMHSHKHYFDDKLIAAVEMMMTVQILYTDYIY